MRRSSWPLWSTEIPATSWFEGPRYRSDHRPKASGWSHCDPSTNPAFGQSSVTASRCGRAAPTPRYPITGIADCCACPARVDVNAGRAAEKRDEIPSPHRLAFRSPHPTISLGESTVVHHSKMGCLCRSGSRARITAAQDISPDCFELRNVHPCSFDGFATRYSKPSKAMCFPVHGQTIPCSPKKNSLFL
jgi:hypothetical protein